MCNKHNEEIVTCNKFIITCDPGNANKMDSSLLKSTTGQFRFLLTKMLCHLLFITPLLACPTTDPQYLEMMYKYKQTKKAPIRNNYMYDNDVHVVKVHKVFYCTCVYNFTQVNVHVATCWYVLCAHTLYITKPTNLSLTREL